jgi:hypothetical protein
MADPSLEDTTIASYAAACVRSFNQCLSSDTLPSYENGWTEDQLARFNIWAANLGVFARGHASADHRLRDCDEIRNLILQLLEALCENLQYSMFLSKVEVQSVASLLIFLVFSTAKDAQRRRRFRCWQ